ncbi:DEAD/DEAH box helicase [Paraconexibacter sp.]|uniref:DEAD/DEAH box helicase n=1 Tax=Paraconexibacter sp. TaxID=2949640 RepID=UPI00356795CF
MADSTTVADQAAALPAPERIAEAEKLTRERFVHEGEDPAVALAPGGARRRALEAAIAEVDAGRKVPSTKWRRRYSLLLGLERVLSEDEPTLADGTLLNPHQVDALAGTLTALLATAQGNGQDVEDDERHPQAAPVLAIEETPDAEADAQDAALEEEIDAFEIDDDFALDEDDEDTATEKSDDDEDEDDDEDVDADIDRAAADDPNAHKRFWFEHATGAGKTVAAMGFVDASRTGGVLILTHRRNLVDQFLGELHTRGYGDRESPPLLDGEGMDRDDGPVTVETYQWFVRNAGRISPAYTIVICDEAHTALGEKTSQAIREWTGPVFVGMTATGALIARHVTDLFPTQTSRFDLAQAARRGVIAPLRCLRIPPGAGVKTIAKVPLRKGDVDVEFDQEMLAELLDQLPFNLAIANLYKTRFNGVPGVVYAAGVRHAYNVAEAFREEGIKAEAVSGETKKRDLAEILARYERGDIDVLVNAQLLAEGWNSPRATVCMHLAPTASKRIYQQRVGRVTRRHPGKEAGVVVDFVHPATRHDDPVVTLHSLLDRDVYRGGAIVVGPVRRGRGRRVRVERRVIPVCAEEERRHEVFERELWRIAVEHLDWGEQHMWAALAGARVAPSGWRRARAMLHFDKTGELKRRFLITAVERNRTSQLRIRALQEIAAARDPEAFDRAHDVIGTWPRDERREGAKVMLQALTEKRIGRRDQANAWIWRFAEYTRELHEEYAVQRWPETKRLLGLLVNSAGGAHARNARRLVQVAKTKDRRLSAALLAAAVAHTPEAESVLRDARTRMARKPSALSRELLRNFPKAKRGRRRRKKKGAGAAAGDEAAKQVAIAAKSRNRKAAEGQLEEEAVDAIAGAVAALEQARAAPVGRPEGRSGNGAVEDGSPEDQSPEGTSARRRARRPERVTNAAEEQDDDDRPTRVADGTVVQRPVALRTVTITPAEDDKPAPKKRSSRRSGAARKRAAARPGQKEQSTETTAPDAPSDDAEQQAAGAKKRTRTGSSAARSRAPETATDTAAPVSDAEALRAKRSAAAKKAAATRKANAARKAAEAAERG